MASGNAQRQVESWATKVGVILAVAGSAVGLGNFLRFPGRAALYGGGAFMIPYFVSLLLLGIPICLIEWTMGRYGGRHGYNSAPGVFRAVWPSTASNVFGALAVFVPVVIYMYYVFIEAWCLSYAWFYLTGAIDAGADPAGYPAYFSAFFNDFIGVAADGALFTGLSPALVALAVCFIFNFFLIYRGLSGGIEKFCQWAMPALVIAALIVLVRVLTLGTPNPELPEQNVINGLGFMWNPKPLYAGEGTFSALTDPIVWVEAAGQVFFTLSVGFGIIVTYASYLKPKDDVTLSALTAASANEFCEVCLGGLITIPAAFIFLGAAPLGALAGSSIGLGFHAVPVTFEYLPLGGFFGFLWFGLLFLAAVTSSISMLQPALAFFEEAFGLGRRAAMAALALVTVPGSLLVAWFTHDTTALGVMDFWVGSLMLVVLALFEVLLFGWVLGARRGIAEANRGSELRLPMFLAPVIRWICPAYLILILGGFAYQNLRPQLEAIGKSPEAMLTTTFLIAVLALFIVLTHLAARRWQRAPRGARRVA